jgi:hypothetical protein
MTSEIAGRPTLAQRHEMIAIAAYYLAEARGFAPGAADADWLRAERTIEALIAERRLVEDMSVETGRRLIRNALVLGDAAAD